MCDDRGIDFESIAIAADDSIAELLQKWREKRSAMTRHAAGFIDMISRRRSFIKRLRSIIIENGKLHWSCFFTPGFWEFKVVGRMTATGNPAGLNPGEAVLLLKVESDEQALEASAVFPLDSKTDISFYMYLPGICPLGGRLYLYGQTVPEGVSVSLKDVSVVGIERSEEGADEI